MKRNKKLIIAITIVCVLAVASSVFAYLYIMTDIFKSNKELFTKYFVQNAEMIEKCTFSQTIEIYKNLENENKYESNTNIKVINSEGGEISNPINNLKAKLDVQKNNQEQYLYMNGQILFEDEKYIEAEMIKNQELYGIRIADAVKQFVSIKNDEKLESIANNIGIDVSKLKKLIDVIDGEKVIDDTQEVYTLKDKYLNIILSAILNSTFQKQKDAIITYNNITTNTNAYSSLLSSEQVRSMLTEIMNNAKNEKQLLDNLPISINIDEIIKLINEGLEIPEIKITVYENNKQTIRTVVEIGTYKTTIENIEENGEIKTKINFDDNETIQVNMVITNKNVQNQENINIDVEVINGDQSYEICILNQMQFLNNQLELNAEISHKQNITTTSLTIENEVIIGENFEKMSNLSLDNNVTLNDLEESKMKLIIDVLKQEYPKFINEKTVLLKQKIGLKNEDDENTQLEIVDESTKQMEQLEINKFNSKFEFYTGEEVSADNVKILLDVVKNNINSHTINTSTLEDEENEKVITLYIEKNKINDESITEALEMIDSNKKYKVEISYKQANGLIDYVKITEL